MLKIVTDDADRDDLTSSLDELVCEGARRMLIAGLESGGRRLHRPAPATC